MKRRITVAVILVIVLTMIVSCVAPTSTSTYRPEEVEIVNYNSGMDS